MRPSRSKPCDWIVILRRVLKPWNAVTLSAAASLPAPLTRAFGRMRLNWPCETSIVGALDGPAATAGLAAAKVPPAARAMMLAAIAIAARARTFHARLCMSTSFMSGVYGRPTEPHTPGTRGRLDRQGVTIDGRECSDQFR